MGAQPAGSDSGAGPDRRTGRRRAQPLQARREAPAARAVVDVRGDIDVRDVDVRDVEDSIDLTASSDRADVPARRRLLIVDDEPDVLGWLRIALEPLRWDVNGARNIAEAQEMAVRLQPDVILLDQQLPDGAGIDLGRWLGEHQPATALLMFSAYIDPATASEAERLGITTLSKRDHRVLISSLSVIRATLDARVAKS